MPQSRGKASSGVLSLRLPGDKTTRSLSWVSCKAFHMSTPTEGRWLQDRSMANYQRASSQASFTERKSLRADELLPRNAIIEQ